MAKIKDVEIVNSHTIKLLSDANKGDEIDLLEISQIDTSIILEKIDAETDKIYNKKLNDLKLHMQSDSNLKMIEATKKLEDEILKLKTLLETKEKEITMSLESKFIVEKGKLENQIALLKSENESFESKKESAVNEVKNKLENELLQVQQKYSSQIYEQKEKISNLELTKSLLSIKKIGEKLEEWCNQEYLTHEINGFDNCTWEKDNISIKDEFSSRATKADYIFKVYSSNIKDESTLLTSVACEMKSEDPTSLNKKKNSDHYAKLDKDRIKKNCEYALLISELEWETDNDAPIRKVVEYDKMYMVRPQYFIVFLSIITALGKKYHDVINEHNIQKEQFKETEEIVEEFEKMKNQILSHSIRLLEKHANSIIDNAQKIEGLSNNILESGRLIINTYLDQIKNKIENFNITKINKKIDKII
ncbi:MAG: DUF2130 domain-containing protein [Bacilli bacterium]|nr:DUF2130 domain-containing protein [Bacilli bacterium]MDD4062894.1 DUF2130 domain-containing protein [Bacilli bacterium]MDD4481945.1 DUF2130 domain-containing protein [Bacilli bacterium]